MEDYRNIKMRTFSKEWWENAWYHYKFYFIGGIIAFVAIAFGISQCAFQVAPDAVFTYIGSHSHFNMTSGYVVEDILKAGVADVSGDGVKTVQSTTVFLDASSSKEMYELASIELSGGKAVVFFMDREYLMSSMHNEYVDMSDWASEYGIDESLCIKDETGAIVGIDMVENPLFAEVDELNPKELYLVVRPIRPDTDKTDRDMQWYNNGLELAQYIISGGEYVSPGI